MKNFTIRIFSLLSFLLLTKTVAAQLVVTSSANANQLAQLLVGGGVTVTNASLTTVADAAGYFTQTATNLGIDSGVLLTSGSVFNAPGPNMGPSTGTSNSYYPNGDPELDSLIPGYTTYDATILEFDVAVTGDSLKFNYVFGSDEYNDFVNTSYNDVFAFFISGPGITGTQNIAIIPGTSTPVSINNVNCGSYGNYYVCNDPWDPAGGGCTTQCPTSPYGTTLEYDGFTTVLQARAAVQTCQTYHLKLAIADAGDHIYDSGVFIEAGSLTTNANAILAVSAFIDPFTGLPAVAEGCFDGSFDIETCFPVVDSVLVPFTIGGTATDGVDYTYIPDSIYILPGNTSATVPIHPISDGLVEGTETLILYLLEPGTNNVVDSAVIEILDSLIAVANPDTTICIGQSIELTANDAGTYFWSSTNAISCNTCQNVLVTPFTSATPSDTIKYVLTISVAGCSATDTATIIVLNPTPVSAGPDVSICLGDSIQLNAINADTYSWSPSGGLSCISCSNPFASPTTTTTYMVTGVNGCFTTSDNVTVTVNPSVSAFAFQSTTICPGDTAQLSASGGTTYSWSPSNGLSCTTCQNPLAVDYTTTSYEVLVSNQFGCSDTASVTISVYDIPVVTISPTDPTTPDINDTTIYLGNSVTLTATGGQTYSWFPSTYLSDPNISNPSCILPQDTIVYYVTVTSAEGCKTIDSVVVNVRWDALVLIPSGFSPNDDSHNDFLRLLVRGIFSLDNFSIYNRWGEVIFQTNDLSYAENTGWDGKYKGTEQPVGVYVYVVTGKDHVGTSVQRQGNITLVR